MAANEIHVGDIGTSFRVTLMDGTAVVDLQAATTLNFHFLKPDETTIVRAAALYTDGTDGIIEYLTVLDDLDQDGRWKLQAEVVLPSGTWKSDISCFRVHKNIS